jgi:uncharacterized phage infection (PIP) family protein YhgE
MCDTTLEESDPFLNLELDIEAGIKQELLSILTNVETVTEAMNKAISKEEDRREQFRILCSSIDYLFGENIKVIEKRKDDLEEIDPSLHSIACKLSTRMERLRKVATKPDLKSMKIEMRRVLSQQEIEKFQTNPQQEEQRPQKG